MGEVVGILIVVFTRFPVLFDFFNFIDYGEAIGILISVDMKLVGDTIVATIHIGSKNGF